MIREPWLLEATESSAKDQWPTRLDQPYVPLECLAVSSDMQLIGAGTIDGTVHLWAADTGRYFGQYGQQHSRRRLAKIVEIARDDRSVLRVKEDLAKTAENGIGLINIDSCEIWSSGDDERKTVPFVNLSADGSTVAYLCEGVVRCCETATKKEWLAIDKCTTAKASGDGNLLVCWQREAQKMVVVDLLKRTRRDPERIDLGQYRVADFGVLPTADYAVLMCDDGTFLFVDTGLGAVSFKWECTGVDDMTWIDTWAISESGNRLLLHLSNGVIYVVDVERASRRRCVASDARSPGIVQSK